MRDFDEWHRLGTHWHAYVEVREQGFPSTRAGRLRRTPDRVLCSPRAVAEWLYRMKRVYLPAQPVKLLGSGAGWGVLGDERHLERDLFEDELAASRGDSLYLSFGCEHDRMDLWVEAVTAQDCSELHREQE
ncbi:hypothetical protein [Actinopolyspora mortivallis]|uniref:Uncharacterized protein n=1 Tax=Actinopolyspora mortivallis TaxID=33906 RepID=A0A2T0GYB5_ACTMO|nr:hypothetical protein [Actinopolyspora mortivallis]PRW64108.1 hypothetical protein CEP50_06800 [Actinopolyspora mortivallis]